MDLEKTESNLNEIGHWKNDCSNVYDVYVSPTETRIKKRTFKHHL